MHISLYYARIHPEYDSSEQFDKRNKLALDIEDDLFSNIKSDGLEENVKVKRVDNESGTSSPKVNK